jgi:PAS domain S-box-containing protein
MAGRVLRRRLTVFVLTFVAGACQTAWAQAPRTVLTVHLSSEDFPGNSLRDAAIRKALISHPVSVDYYAEYLESDRFPAEEASLALRDYIGRKYRGRTIDVVLAIGDVPLEFVLRFRGELFPNASIVFWGLAPPEASTRGLGAGITGVVPSGPTYDDTLELALKLHPATERIWVVAQAPDRTVEGVMRRGLDEFGQQAPLSHITERSLPSLLNAIKGLSARSLVFYVRYSQEDPGHVLFPPEVAGMVAQASRVPVYVNTDSHIGSGVVGGMLYDTEALATRVGEMARQILAGTRAQDIPLEQPRRVPTFDWRQLQRWGISESQLPANSTILYRQPGVWELYRPHILGGALLVSLQSAFIAALLIQRMRRKASEDALRESQQRLTMATAAGALGVWDWNFETNELYVDPGLKSLLGFDDAEISTRPEDWGSRVHPQDLSASAAQVKACMDGETDVYEVEHRMVHKDGSEKWFLSRGSAIRSANGTLRRIVGTKVDITARKRAEEAIRESEAELQASHREIQRLAGSLIAAQDTERTRIARDLHDDVSQQLAALSIALSALKRRVRDASPNAELQYGVSSIQQRAVALAESVRDLSHDLHPDVLKHAGLTATLASHCAGLSGVQGMAVTCTAEGDFESIEPEIALCLYRIAQEALHNVVKHSGARQAEVHLVRTSDCAEVTVSDNGKGFDIAETRKNGSGLGLISINERVRLAGGTLSVMTEWNKGTQVRARVPTRPAIRPDAGDASGRYATT